MATLRSRGEIVAPSETVSLKMEFYDLNGNLTSLQGGSFPTVTIVQPDGLVILGPTSSGVYSLSDGVFGFDYITTLGSAIGVYSDVWRGVIPSGQVITKDRNFIVNLSQMPLGNNVDGYYALGDDIPFNYSQCAIININKLLKSLKERLRSSGMVAGQDQFGNPIYRECDIFNPTTLITFLCNALSYFNSTPHFTYFTFEDTPIINLFHDMFVEIAFAAALGSQALIERGSEWNMTDSGVAFTPPALSDMLNTQSSYWGTQIRERVKDAKLSMKPAPLGLASMWNGNVGRSPALSRLRHLRARQII